MTAMKMTSYSGDNETTMSYHEDHATDPQHPGYMTHAPVKGTPRRYVRVKLLEKGQRWHYALQTGKTSFIYVNKEGEETLRGLMALPTEVKVVPARLNLLYITLEV